MIEEQIKEMEKQLEALEGLDVTAEYVTSNLVKPKDELAAYAIKCQTKNDAIQDTLGGLKSLEEIDNV